MNAASISLSGGMIGVAIALVVGWVRPAWAAWAAAAGAGAACGGGAVAWASGATNLVNVAWIPVLGSRFVLAMDPLAAPFVVFMTGIAVPIFIYTAAYLPHHLEKENKSLHEQARFCRLMLGFMVAMVLVVTTQDLVVLFGALELTALASFLLIEFDREKPKSRNAALLALIVTAGSSLLYLVGILLIAARHETTFIPDLRDAEISTLAAALIVAGVIGKSAQVPLYFWLPRAMAAPTPVSAYLHSAALVAAGVFVLQRLRILLDGSPGVLAALLVIGFASIFLGGALALVSDSMKRVLAYSTIAQYGYASVLIALGGSYGDFGAPFFILAHGVCKAALFMTAGAVTSVTQAKKLSQTGGLLRRMQSLAAASAIAAIGLAGLPLTIGYFKDEMFFAAAVHHGTLSSVLATLAAAMTLAYITRFWWEIFMGAPASQGRAPSSVMTAPVWLLAIATLIGGFWTAPLAEVFANAGEVVGGERPAVSLSYEIPKPETAMALAAWTAGLVAFATRRFWEMPLRKTIIYVSYGFGPALWSDRIGEAVSRASDSLYTFELRDLRDRIGIILLPTATLLLFGVYAYGGFPASAGPVQIQDAPVIIGLAVASGAAIAVVHADRHIPMILLLSFVGFGLALTFVLSGAPDVALVLAVIETALTLLLLAVLWQIRPNVFRQAQRSVPDGPRGPWIGLFGGATAFFLSWFALSVPQREGIAKSYIEIAERAHAKDVVTAILADFRGLDTSGEITVVAVALFGAAAITWGRAA